MSKQKQADAADEMAQTIPGADQTENAEMKASFDAESNGKPQPEVKEVKEVREPDGKEVPVVEKPDAKVGAPDEKPRDADGKFIAKEGAPVETPVKVEGESSETPAPKTAVERAEEAAKALDVGKGAAGDDKSDVLDALPPEYAWARQAKESGQIAEFLKTQPKAVQKAAASGDVDDATYVLDLFKKSKEPVPTQEPTAKEIKSLLAEFGHVKFRAPDGTEKTLKAMADEYGNHEILEAFAALNKAMLGGAPKVQTFDAKPGAIDALQERIDRMKQDQDFWEEILEVHSDGRKLVRSGKIKEWVEKNGTDAIKRLHLSPNPAHGILVIDAYKEAMALEVKLDVDKVSGDKKKQLDGLHGESLRPKREVKAITPKSDNPNDFNEAFEEESKK